MHRVGAAAAAILTLGLTACGGGVETPTASPAVKVAPSGAISPQASAICAAMQRGSNALAGGQKPSKAEVIRLLARWRSGFGRLARLEPPAGRAKPFEQMLADYRRMTAALAAMEAADDESVLPAAAGAIVAGTRGSRAARAAGLPKCAFFPELKQPPRDPETPFVATRALVPSGARIVKADSRDCNAFASCRFEFDASGSTGDELRSALAALRSHGWRHARTGRSPTGSHWAIAYRNDLEVEIELLGERTPAHCAGRNARGFGCSDSVWVHRVRIPALLTGG
jgi:hypothetical protein